MHSFQKTLIAFLLVIIFFISAHAQNYNEIDSMVGALKIAKEDTNKVNLLNSISRELWQNNDFNPAKKYADNALLLSKKINFKKGQAKALNNIGVTFWYQGNYSDALENYFASLKIGEEQGDKEGISVCYSNIGLIYYEQGNYSDALKYSILALKISEDMRDKEGMSITTNTIGVIYLHQKNYSEALKNYLISLKIKEEIGDKRGAAKCYNNIGTVYDFQGNSTEALKNYFASLKIKEEIGDQRGVANCYENIGSVYEEHGDYQKALKYQLDGLKIRQELEDKEGVCSSYIQLGTISIHLKRYTDAKNYLTNGLSISSELGNKDEIKDCYGRLSVLDSAVGNFRLSLEHYKLYTLYRDSLLNETSSEQANEMKAKYESEKKEKGIALLTKDKLIQNIEIKKQTVLKNSLLGGLALALALFFFIYNNYRTSQKLKLENIRNNIAADLHDDIGSTLNSISLFSEVAKQEAGKPIPALDQIGVSARKIIDAMSDIVWTINPENDTFENVIARMRSLSYLLLKAKAIEFTFKADEDLNRLSLPIPVRKNVYLLFKEAINNLVKYSNASRASFHISLDNKNVKLVIRDNGVGFDMENAPMGNGIKNMNRRAAEIEAQFIIESAEGKGTNIELIFKT